MGQLGQARGCSPSDHFFVLFSRVLLVSQVLLAGGIPMDEVGDACWYWHTHDYQDYSWINVGNFMDYAKANTGYGLVSLPEAA